MSFFQLTKKDILLIEEIQPQLNYNSKNKVLNGFLQFEGEYQGYKIKDKYKIEVDFNNQLPLPLVKEINGRIEKIAKDKKKKLKDLHVNYGDINKGLCLCSRFEAFKYVNKFKNSLSPCINFIQELVIPFLYGISYFEKYDYFPFGGIDHGPLGLVKEENNKECFKYLPDYLKTLPEEAMGFIDAYSKFFKLKNIICKTEKIGRNKPCPCNSGLKYKKCHLDIVNIITKSISDFKTRNSLKKTS